MGGRENVLYILPDMYSAVLGNDAKCDVFSCDRSEMLEEV